MKPWKVHHRHGLGSDSQQRVQLKPGAARPQPRMDPPGPSDSESAATVLVTCCLPAEGKTLAEIFTREVLSKDGV